VLDNYSYKYAYGVGNLWFKKQNINDYDFNQYNNDKGNRQFYVQLHFDVMFSNNASSQEYDGVVLALSDELTLYN